MYRTPLQLGQDGEVVNGCRAAFGVRAVIGQLRRTRDVQPFPATGDGQSRFIKVRDGGLGQGLFDFFFRLRQPGVAGCQRRAQCACGEGLPKEVAEQLAGALPRQ